MATRPFHFLSPNKSSSRPSNVIFFDTETRPLPLPNGEVQQVLKLGWLCYLRGNESIGKLNPQWVYFTTKQEFWDYVDSRIRPKTKLYLVAHNVGFDFRIVGGFAHARDCEWDLKGFYNKGMTCIIKYRVNSATVQVLDTTNFYPVALEKLGKMVGLDKKAIDFETCSDSDLSDYCKRDVQILVEAWQNWLDFLDEHDLGKFQNTLPSTAFGAYRHRFMPVKIGIHTNDKICELERESYRGGRTECFKVGVFPKDVYYQLDVNAMYAYVMHVEKYPYLLRGSRKALGVKGLKNKLRNFAVVARVVVKTEYPTFPVKHDGRNVYPVGTFETVLTTPEIKFVLDHCELVAIKDVAWYRQTHIFRDYAKYFSDLRQEYETSGNITFRQIAKLFNNALYGKFGQRGIKTTFDVNDPTGTAKDRLVYHHQKKEWCRSYKLGDTVVFEESRGESYNSFPAISSHVTAYARMYLWSLINKAGRENVFYCDTDCLIVNREGYDRLQTLLHPHKLGYLKVEKQGNSLEIRAPKDYTLGSKIRMKGIRKNAILQREGVYEQDQFLGLPGAIRREQPDLVTVKRVTKTLRRKVKTGIVQPSGWVKPFVFPL